MKLINYSQTEAARRMLRDLHTLFSVRYREDERGWRISSGYPDVRLKAFLGLFGELAQDEIIKHVKELREQRAAKEASRLVGGPFDGEQIVVLKDGGTFCRKIHYAWWAVYKRKPGEYPAEFVGFATSESNGRSYSLAHATAKAEIQPMRNQERLVGINPFKEMRRARSRLAGLPEQRVGHLHEKVFDVGKKAGLFGRRSGAGPAHGGVVGEYWIEGWTAGYKERAMMKKNVAVSHWNDDDCA